MGKMTIFGGAIAAFIVIVIGLTFLDTSADTIASTSETFSNTVEINITAGTPATIVASTDDLISVVSLSRGAVTYTTTSNYSVDLAADTVNLTDSGMANQTFYNVSYTYNDANYVADGASRSVIGLIKIMFALAVFLSAAGFVAWKELGM